MTRAAEYNKDYSATGRITTDAADTSVDAASSFSVESHRQIILDALDDAGGSGLTSIEAARYLPLTAQGTPQVSNRSASRLQELWERRSAAIAREHGRCVLGVCHPHHKPDTVHKPTADCDRHGKPLRRGGASIWIAI